MSDGVQEHYESGISSQRFNDRNIPEIQKPSIIKKNYISIFFRFSFILQLKQDYSTINIVREINV